MHASVAPRSARIALLLLLLTATACRKSGQLAPCNQDSECQEDEVCFVDGCGDPGKDIRVEVTPRTTAGLYAQDVVVDDLKAREDFEVPTPALLQGSVEVTPPQTELPKDTAVAIRAQGESEVIPGVLRTFESTLHPLRENGAFSLPVSSGVYSITANVLGSPLPLTIQLRAIARAGTASNLDLLFAAAPIYSVSGQLVFTGGRSAEMEVQAFSDAVSLRPLSQRVPVAPTGDFTLALSRAVFLPPRSFVIQASPKDPAALVPQKMFPTQVQDPPMRLMLEMGDFGGSVNVMGVIQTSRGAPVASATVSVEGRVRGGGTFKSQSVLTDSIGRFSLQTLSNPVDQRSTVWVIPPVQSPAGILRASVDIRGPGSLGNIACPDKIRVEGKIFRPDGSNAPGVRVMAVPTRAVDGKPLPPPGAQTFTDDDSSFSLSLDPAVYRLDFIPGEQLPRVSRFASVATDPVRLSDFTLSKGRRITGSVYAVAAPAGANASIAPFSALRFFRLITVEGKQSSVLLAETVSDGRGTYSVTLPTR